jgi:enterochelin esterase-like enzyme
MDMPATRKLAAFAAAILVAAIGFAAEAGQLVSAQFRSPALGRDWVYNVYLPDGYETGRLRYPVLYLLHGNAADQNEWVSKGMVHRTVDALIAAGEIPPCLVVMPSAGVTWYVDRQENVETAFIQDLIPEVERRYRAIHDRFGRVIGGESMGGYGSLRFALKYPELFAAAALFSPAIYVPEPPPSSSARRVPPFQTNGQFDPEVWKSLNYPALLDAVMAKNILMPIYVDSGDHDDFQIEYQAAVLYKTWRNHNWPAEFRVVEGVHNFGVWRNTAREGIRFAFETARRPELIGADETAAAHP